MRVECAVCGTPFQKQGRRTQRRYCSARCRKRMDHARDWGREPNPPTLEQRECYCGVEFTPTRVTQKYCTRSCRNRLYTKRRKAGGLSLVALWKRARGACFVCGLPCFLDRKWPDDLATTIEHIVPLSRGGTSEPENVTISHWKCNREKGVA